MAGAKPAVHVVQLKQISVPEVLIKGNKFIKWDDSSAIGVPVTLRVDAKGHILYWRDQNKDMDFLDISNIRDARTGKYARVPKEGKLRDSCTIGSSDIPIEDKSVTIVHGTDLVNVEFVNYVCTSRELAVILSDELMKYSNNLLALNGSCLTFLEKAFTRLTHVLDVNGKIPVKNILKMMTKDNKDDRRKVEKALEAAGYKVSKNDTIDPNKFTFDDFFTFYRHLVGRTEVDIVFGEMGAKRKPYLTSEQFVKFLNNEQRDPRLNEILYPFYTLKQAVDFIKLYETKSNMADKGHFSQEGFLKFLMGEDNNLIPGEYLDLSQDMTQPLSHYFINSSHNTYLTGHQLTGRSSVEIYHQVLLSGCRCIELDCWDGKGADEEPIITHGFTMCTEILFKDVIEAIAASAFKTSCYPVILSFENHCSHKQQAKMAEHCRHIFGEMLLIDPLEGYPLEPDVPLPSPELLKYKIIVKNRKKHFHKNKQKVTSPKTTNPRKIRTGSSFDQEDLTTSSTVITTITSATSWTESDDTKHAKLESMSDNLDKKPERTDDDVYDSESSDSDDEEVSGLTEEQEKERQQEKGTAGSEAEAGMEMSALVNYVQPVHFHSFDVSEKKNRAYEISSFVETQATNLLKEHPVDFVNYNKRQLSRVYPRGTRVDSSNFMPQLVMAAAALCYACLVHGRSLISVLPLISEGHSPILHLGMHVLGVSGSYTQDNGMPQLFWNAGCQLVALNFQTLDLAMQLNLGIFEYNCKSGYVIKPDFMRRQDKSFDPFAESTVDGIIAGTVSVRVISGQFVSDKKVGTYVEVDMYGLPTDTHRKKFRTKTVPNNGINPVYDDSPFVFKKVVLPNLAVIRIGVYEETGKLIGHRVLSVEALRPGYRHICLRNECNLPLLLPTLFVHISVKDYVSDKHADFAEALTNPLQYLSMLDRHEKQLSVLDDNFGIDQASDIPDTAPVHIPDGHRSSNQSPIKPSKINGSLPNMFKNGSNDVLPKLSRTSSNTYSKVSTYEGNLVQSDALGGITGVARMPSNESVVTGISVISTTKLNEPNLLTPTPLQDLKKVKSYFKMLVKQDKEMEILKRKHDKAQDNMHEVHMMQDEKLLTQQQKERATLEKAHSKTLKKACKSGNLVEVQQQTTEEFTRLTWEHEEKVKALKKSQSEVFVAMCEDQFQAELEVYQKYSPPIYEVLTQIMDQNHKEHEQRLQNIHDQEVKDLTKRMEAQTKEEMKVLQKAHRDKQAFSRLKRENQKKHIDTVVNERTKLQEILDNRLTELRKNHQLIRVELEKDRLLVEKQYKDQFHDKCTKIREQYCHLLELDVTMSPAVLTSHITTSNSTEDYIISTPL